MYMKIIFSFQINFMHSLWFPLSLDAVALSVCLEVISESM